MKQLLLPILILCSGFYFASCKTGARTGGEKNNATKVENQSQMTDTLPRWVTLDRTQAASAQEFYPCVVSFISIGAGTDPAARQKLEDCIDRFEARNSRKIHGVIIPWGREGEGDFCFDLKGMDTNLQAQFVEDLNVAFKGMELVQVHQQFRNRFKP